MKSKILWSCVFHAILTLSVFVGPSEGQARGNGYVLSKVWWWYREVQIQIDRTDKKASYLFNLKLNDNAVLSGSFDAIGDVNRPFLDSCHMRDMLVEALKPKPVDSRAQRDEDNEGTITISHLGGSLPPWYTPLRMELIIAGLRGCMPLDYQSLEGFDKHPDRLVIEDKFVKQLMEN